MQKREFLKSALGGAILASGITAIHAEEAKPAAAPATPAAPTLPPAPDPSINFENQNYFADILQKYRHDKKVGEVMLVRYLGGSNAHIEFYKKTVNDAWELRFETDGYVGKNGIDKTKEGDAKTPTGDFGILNAFGILPNPGTKLHYTAVTPTTFACDEEGPYYNTIIDAKKVGHACKGEEMYEVSPQYNYGIETDFNRERVYPKGSAIFLHVKGVKPYTGGCVAIDQEHMKTVLKLAGPGMRIVVHAN